MTGLISTASRKIMSRATPLRTFGSGESMKLPPYLITKVAPLNLWMYGNASSSVAALAMRSCILSPQRTRIAHIAFVEFHIILRQVGGVHQSAGFPKVQIYVQVEFFRRDGAAKVL